MLISVKPPPSRVFNHMKNISLATIKNFLEKSTLDTSQREAFLVALQNPVSLIQGPPGTGSRKNKPFSHFF